MPLYLLPSTPGLIWVLPSGDATGATDAANLTNAANQIGVGTIRLAKGEYYINATLPMKPGQFWEGVGTEATRMRPVGTITMFGYNYSGGLQEVAWGIDKMTLYGYNNDSVVLNNKLSTKALWDVKLGRVYIDGFGNGRPANTNAVVIIGDPWGFRCLETIIEQIGPRTALKITNNGTSNNDAKLIGCKIANNGGDNVHAVGCSGITIDGSTMYTLGTAAANIRLDGTGASSITNNDIQVAAGQFGIGVINGSVGNYIAGGRINGNSTATSTGIIIDGSSQYTHGEVLVYGCATPLSNAGGATNTLVRRGP